MFGYRLNAEAAPIIFGYLVNMRSRTPSSVPQGELEGGEKVEYLEGEPANAEEDDHHEEHLCHLQLDRHSSDLVQLIQL